jgi:CRISPR-associated protein Cas1
VGLFGNIQISTQAVQALCDRDIPVSYFSMGGWFYGVTHGHGLKNVFTRVRQFAAAADPAASLALARQFVHGKVRNHRTLLMRNHIEPPAPAVMKLRTLSEEALGASSTESLLGIEGAAAALYFSEFSGMLKSDGNGGELPGVAGNSAGQLGLFDFSGRNRRPPTDPVNALLSLAYSLLSKDCAVAAMAVGFDPYVGFYHQPRFGRPSLALDVMEEFRPLIAESAVLNCVNNKMLAPRHFVRAGRAVNLNAEGRKLFFQVYEQRINTLVTHPVFDYKVCYRRVVELQFRILARYLTGEIAIYTPFTTR